MTNFGEALGVGSGVAFYLSVMGVPQQMAVYVSLIAATAHVLYRTLIQRLDQAGSGKTNKKTKTRPKKTNNKNDEQRPRE